MDDGQSKEATRDSGLDQPPQAEDFGHAMDALGWEDWEPQAAESQRPWWKLRPLQVGAAVVLGGVGLSAVGLLLAHAGPPPTSSFTTTVAANAVSARADVVVDVHGDVVRPGVYRLPPGSRVVDAVRAAGGFRHPEDAGGINAAEPLNDGEEVVVPAMSAPASSDSADPGSTQTAGAVPAETTAPSTSSASGAGSGALASAHTHRIDVNTATLAALETLPGIGPARAEAILEYRQAHGPFHSLDELRMVHGIGPATWARITPYLYISAPHGSGGS